MSNSEWRPSAKPTWAQRFWNHSREPLIKFHFQRNFPAGAKARGYFSAIYGTTEVVPFQNIDSSFAVAPWQFLLSSFPGLFLAGIQITGQR
jgi:hypothetical protein